VTRRPSRQSREVFADRAGATAPGGIFAAAMSRPPAPVLDYSKHSDRRADVPRGLRWVVYLLAAVPVAAAVSVHLVYAVEWCVNGERPIPPHHGPDNVVEEVVYWASGILMMLFGVGVAGAMVLPLVALAKGLSRVTLVLFLPAATWLTSFALLAVDPLRAMAFWVD
jgi:hypothetical protein